MMRAEPLRGILIGERRAAISRAAIILEGFSTRKHCASRGSRWESTHTCAERMFVDTCTYGYCTRKSCALHRTMGPKTCPRRQDTLHVHKSLE